ncbi:MAG: hypothetical protein II363_01195 [Clostridia bacterium]|nr:hypothetical protein [Clostridia bacterium]
MSTRQSKKRTHSWAWRVVIVAFAAFLFVKLVQLHVQIQKKEQQLALVNESIYKQELIIEDLNEQIENADDYLERYANEAGWVLPGQQIYQNIAG